MAIKFKNILTYIIYFFIVILSYHIIKKSLRTQKNNQLSSLNNYNTNLVELSNNEKSYTLDSYEPRFIAPRYYDTQIMTERQPIYTRTFGNYIGRGKCMCKRKCRCKGRRNSTDSSYSSEDS